MADVHDTRRVVDEAQRSAHADRAATQLATTLLAGGAKELANVPLHLLHLRQAAVAALHTFNHAEAKRAAQRAQHVAQAATDLTAAAGGAAGGAGGCGVTTDDAGGDAGAAPAVGLELASALNGLELELLSAQRQRRRQQAEVSGGEWDLVPSTRAVLPSPPLPLPLVVTCAVGTLDSFDPLFPRCFTTRSAPLARLKARLQSREKP